MSQYIRPIPGTARLRKSQTITSIQFNIPNTMSHIKTWLLEQQRLRDAAVKTEYTEDQLFVLNDIANEQEQLMQELMSEEVSGDADYHQE